MKTNINILRCISFFLIICCILSFAVLATDGSELSFSTDLPESLEAAQGTDYSLSVIVNADGDSNLGYTWYGNSGVLLSGTFDGGILTVNLSAKADDTVYCEVQGSQKTITSRRCSIIVSGSTSDGGNTQSTATTSPAQTSSPSPSPTAESSDTGSASGEGKITITKNPTSESVAAGGSATFIAHATNSLKISWRIIKPDGTSLYNASEIASFVTGLKVSGADTDTLVLSNIPASMSGWYVEAKYSNNSGDAFTTRAKITVTSKTLTSPVISSGPKDTECVQGETVTLSVIAKCSSGTLKYQWYKADTNDNKKGNLISGATYSTYTFAPAESAWYYVCVWASDGTSSSEILSSDAVAVTVKETEEKEEAAPTTSSPSPSPLPSSADDAASGNSEEEVKEEASNEVLPSESPSETENAHSTDQTVRLVLIGICVICVCVISVCAFLLYRSKGKKHPEDDSDEETE